MTSESVSSTREVLVDSQDLLHYSDEEINVGKEFYVESEFVPARDNSEIIVQQTIDTKCSYSYDVCYNEYCKASFMSTNKSDESTHNGSMGSEEFSMSNLSISNSVSSDANGNTYSWSADFASDQTSPPAMQSSRSLENTVSQPSTVQPAPEIPHISLPYLSTVTSSSKTQTADPHHPQFQSNNRMQNQELLQTNSSSVQSDSTISTQRRQTETAVGIADYIQNDDCPSLENRSQNLHRSRKRNPPPKRKPPQPWYCITRPISEQTRDIKISHVNKSSSINISRLLQHCRSIVEFCMPESPLDERNIDAMNFNHSWGDSLPSGVKGSTIRVVYQNVNRSVSASDNPLTTNLLDNLNNMEADVFMASESNVNWKSATFRNDFKRKVSGIWPANRVSFSTSDVGLEFEAHEYLPGGTCTMAVDNLSMRVVKVGEDSSGLGRWSYITLEGQGGHSSRKRLIFSFKSFNT